MKEGYLGISAFLTKIMCITLHDLHKSVMAQELAAAYQGKVLAGDRIEEALAWHKPPKTDTSVDKSVSQLLTHNIRFMQAEPSRWSDAIPASASVSATVWKRQ